MFTETKLKQSAHQFEPSNIPPRSGHRRRVALLGLALALGAAGTVARPSVARADEAPYAITRAYNVVQAEGKMIMAWVYPTVTFQRSGGCSWTPGELSCEFDYIDTDGSRGHRHLAFRLDAGGLIDGIDDQGGESIVPPFLALTLTSNLLGEMAKEDLAKNAPDESEADKALIRLLAESPSPRKILAFLLNVRIASS